jgi:hypothetical protein
MDLKDQLDLVQKFRSWFEGGTGAQGQSVKNVIEDNRRRYRMLLSDYNERIERGLSALPSTKSVSTVDNAVIDTIQEYFETDAINFTAQDTGDINKDHLAKWLTEIFRYRCNNTFPFWVWMIQSLKAGYVDGIEAAFVRWRKEEYPYSETKYHNLMAGTEISKDEYKAGLEAGDITVDGLVIKADDIFHKETESKTRTTKDTWHLDQLKPGENLLWDFKNPVIDLNEGSWCIVISPVTKEEILQNSRKGIFKKGIKEADLTPFLAGGANQIRQADYTDYTALATDPDSVDMGEYNRIELWTVFEKVDSCWKVSFSLRGELELKGQETVNDVFFGGRPFDRLPVVMGASDIELWEALGRGIPKLIAPIEDELTDHKNNINDMAKEAAQGKYRLDPDSDVDIDSLLNDKVFYAKPGEVEKLDRAQEMAVVMRAADQAGGDIAEVAGAGMQSKFLVPKNAGGNTLGAAQLAQGQTDKKLSTRMLVRNVTFMRPVLRIIAEMEFAFETDEIIARIAAKQGKVDINPMSTVSQGKPMVDFSKLDFDVDVQINAGLGSVPKQQKIQKMMQIAEWALGHKRPVDIDKIYKQAMVLSGFNEEQFDLDQPPPPTPPPVDYKLNLTMGYEDIMGMAQMAGGNPQQVSQFFMKLLVEGHMDVATKVQESKEMKQRKENIKELGQVGSISHPGATQQQPQGEVG